MTPMSSVGAAPADQERKAPGRPRSAQADEAIIEAVLDLLADGTTPEALSIEAVAARAGVGKATIYRRWTSKEALILDAVVKLKGAPPELAGVSVRDDLVALIRPIGRPESTRAGRIMPCLIPVIHRSPSLQRAYHKLLAPRRELMRGVIARGMASGELRADIDVDIIMAMLSGPMVAQSIMKWNPDLPPPDELAERLVAAIWPGITPASATA